MMSTQNQAEHGVIHSSIALLQERFRQLQRVKEMREKKQLLTLFSDNYKLNIPSDSYHYEPSTASPITTPSTTTTTTTSTTTNNNDVVVVDDDELHIFLPPNYYYTNYSRSSSSNNNKPTSCYSSSLSHNNNNTNNNNNNLDYPNINNNNLTEISLSLWPPAPAISYNNANAAAAGGGSLEAPASTFSNRPPSCVPTASKIEDSQHVSDVDTTLHL